jgi:hypothetical protein
MTEERDIEEDLKIQDKDVSHAIIKSSLSFAPIVGGPISEFFSLVIAPPLEQRRDEWLIKIFTRLKKLETEVQGFKIENLAKNEIFISTLLHATQIAIRTHQQEKIEALRNAVVNSAMLRVSDENYQLMFLNIVDRLTPMHLFVLHVSNKSGGYGNQHDSADGSWEEIAKLDSTIPDISRDRPILMQIINDLTSDGLLTYDVEGRYHGPLERLSFSTTTELGKKILEFISCEEIE